MGLSIHYFAMECGPLQTSDELVPAALCAAEMGRVAGGEQQMGKRGWEDGITCAKRARIQHFGAPADACIEDAPDGGGNANSNFMYMGDDLPHAPETVIIPQAHVQDTPSVYEQYLQKEREWGSASASQAGRNRQGHTSTLECPSAYSSGWSGTEWDCCPVPIANQQQHAAMDCDGGAEARYRFDLYPRGC